MGFDHKMIDKKDWPALISGLRQTLLEHATAKSEDEKRDNPEAVKARRERLDHDLRRMDNLRLDLKMEDEILWPEIAIKPFYARREAAVVNKFKDYMLENYLGEPEPLCDPEWDWEAGKIEVNGKAELKCKQRDATNGVRYQQFVTDKKCYKSHVKVQKVITAARLIAAGRKIYPHRNMIDHLTEFKRDFDDINQLKSAYDLGLKYLQLGPVTTFHLMTDLGFQVVKPDSVLTRVAINLGLMDAQRVKGYPKKLGRFITNEDAISVISKIDICWALQARFQEVAEAAQTSIRSLDYIMVKLGQEPDEANGIARTICRDKGPLCDLCSAQPLCAYANASKA